MSVALLGGRDSARDPDREPEPVAVLELRGQPAGDPVGLISAGVMEQHKEFVTARTRDGGAWRDNRPELARDLDQHLVAGLRVRRCSLMVRKLLMSIDSTGGYRESAGRNPSGCFSSGFDFSKMPADPVTDVRRR